MTEKEEMTVPEKKPRRILQALLFFVLLSLSAGSFYSLHAYAAPDGYVYTNPETGYSVYISDRQNLLTGSQEIALIEDMKPVTEYGNAGFISSYNTVDSISSFSRELYTEVFGSENGSLFVIDMGLRQIYLCNGGEYRRLITTAYSKTITDNVYKYARDGEYYVCASNVFRQVTTVLQGGRIAQPMRYISAALLALTLSLTINYLIVLFYTSASKATEEEIIDAADVDFMFRNPRSYKDHTSRVYSPIRHSGRG